MFLGNFGVEWHKGGSSTLLLIYVDPIKRSFITVANDYCKVEILVLFTRRLLEGSGYIASSTHPLF